MADLALTVDLSQRALTTSLADAAPLVLGDKLRVAFAFTRNVDGSDVPEPDFAARIRALRISLGKTLAPPDSGVFSLESEKLDATPVALANVDVLFDDASMLAKLAPLAWVTAVEKSAPGVWVLTSSVTDNLSAPPDFTVTMNKLAPVSFVRARAFKDDGYWCVEIRCIQTPYAFASAFDLILPPPPSIKPVRAGGSGTDGVIINEIQQLTIPADFNGLYTITYDLRETKVLGLQDGAPQIAAALNALWQDGKTRFTASLPEDNVIHIEATGPLENTDIALMNVTVRSFHPGTVNFLLDLATAELATALRDKAQLADVPFECEVDIVEQGESPADEDAPARTITLFQDKANIAREQIWPELALVPAIDWIRPPVARDYVAITTDQLLVGTQETYVSPRGNGVLRSFACDHGLATEDIISVVVKDNATGAALVQGVAFDWTVTNVNTVTVDVHTGWATPGVNAWAILITASGPTTAFQAHTHTTGQIVGLDDALALLAARVAAIEDLLPTAPPTIEAGAAGGTLSIPISDATQLVPGRWIPTFDPKAAFAKGTGLPNRGYGLLPAIHTAAPTNAAALPGLAADFAGIAYVNTAGAAYTIPGGLGRKSVSVPVGGFYGSDGRVWYALTRDIAPAATKSYFPTDFERTLFRLALSDKMLRAGQTLTCEFDLTLAMIKADTAAQWLLVIEWGTATQATSPATTGENLGDITWNATPLLSQRIIMTGVAAPFRYGVKIARNAAGDAITADRLLYGQYETCGSQPDTANFALRARLIQFDTQDSVTGARGWAYFDFANAKAGIS